MASKVYDIITAKIIDALDAGIIPWRKPWRSEAGIGATNLVSGKAYRGINQFLLSIMPYKSPYWVTFKQAQAMGGQVRKGEHGTPIVFWNWAKRASVNADGDTVEKNIPMLRYYTGFNLTQVDGIPEHKLPPAPVVVPFEPIGRCQSIVAHMPGAPEIQHGTPGAFYRPATDQVFMPDPGYFVAPEAYYATLFHELAHSTGHAKRLNRKTLVDCTPFGTVTYSREELVAEMTAAFVCGVAGIDTPELHTNAVAYIQNWRQKLLEDPQAVIVAAQQAQHAADLILNAKEEQTQGEQAA